MFSRFWNERFAFSPLNKITHTGANEFNYFSDFRYKFTSCVILQHSVSKLCFQPLNEDSTKDDITEYVFATLCSDKKFRLWNCEYSFKSTNYDYNFQSTYLFLPSWLISIRIVCVIAGASARWNCFSIGYYRDHSLHDLSFSGDGSLLGAAFGPCLTLWDSETHSMKCSLSKGPEPLR